MFQIDYHVRKYFLTTLPSGLLYCIGSEYKIWEFYFEIPGRGELSTLPVNIFGHFVGTIAKMSCWNPDWLGDHDPVVHDSL